MKILISLVVGLVCGIVLFVATLYYNPFSGKQTLSPLAVGNQQLLSLSYTGVPSEAILFTNNGESVIDPHPEKTAQLWESTVQNSRVMVVELTNSRGEPAGIGIKFSSDSESTRILNSQAIVDSAWHIYLPERGTLFVAQRENYWSYICDIIVSARRNSADSWRGAWSRVMTIGPNAIGTGRVTGGSGEFAGIESEVVETLNATAYSAQIGPVAMDGNLTISLPGTSISRAAQQN